MDGARKLALVAEDVEINCDILCDILEDNGYAAIGTHNGRELLDQLALHPEAVVILLDLTMPVMGGIEVLAYLQEHGLLQKYPVLVLTADETNEIEKQCLEYGISEFLRKPFKPVADILRINNAVEFFEIKNHLDDKVAEQTEQLREQNEQLHRMNMAVITLLGEVVEMRNEESGFHIQRVAGFTKILADELMGRYPEYELTPEKIDLLVATSSLHDVGKLLIKDAILLKPGKFTPEEFAIMKTHTSLGGEVLTRAEGIWPEEYSRLSEDICKYHHERYDGRGYPYGLVGDEIPISAQIVSLADVYDALVTERVYKKPFPTDVAYRMILNGECGIFNPKLLECFTARLADMQALVS